jgi:outer membrane biosynthesis protein TonB
MQKEDKKRRLLGVSSTILFHLLLVVLLVAMGLTYPQPPPAELGVEMDMGSLTDVGNALPGELGGAEADNSTSMNSHEEDANATQNIENSPLVSKPKTTTKPTVKQPTKPETTPSLDPNALFQKGKVKNANGNGQGNGQGSGIGDGNNGGGGTGSDYSGSGVSFSLNGRSAKALPKPAVSTSEEGKVLVDILVDKEGNVIRATAGGRGTTIANGSILKQCEQAAKKSKFSVNANAVEEQKGTITYIFKL